jgi:hypothetical protein
MDPQTQHHPWQSSLTRLREVLTRSPAREFTAQPTQGHACSGTRREQTPAPQAPGRLIVALAVCAALVGQIVPPVLGGELWQTSSDAQVAKVVGALQSGTPVEEALSGGESHAYRLQLEANQYLRVMVEQKGIDVAMTLFRPDEAILAEIILPHTLQGRKVIIAVTEQSGNHRLEVRSQKKDAAAGRYEV